LRSAKIVCAVTENRYRQGLHLHSLRVVIADIAALRAVRLAAVIGPVDFDELGVRFLIRHARDGR
jgi:hypothetical protein